MPKSKAKKPLSFEDAISSSPLSVYIGRIVYMPSSWKENGLVYVDLNALDGAIKNPKSSEDNGKEMEHELESYGYRRAMLPRGLVMAANLWESPQTIYYKGSFAGNGSISISNYMFDPLTMTWITTVSTALNAIGVVNVPPIFVSLSETGIPAPATSVDVGQVVEEAFSDALSSMTSPLEPGSNESALPSIDASDIIDKVKSSIIGSIQILPGNGAAQMLSEGVKLVSGLLPKLKTAYGYDEIIKKRDELHEALTDAEKQIVQKINALQKSAEDQLKNVASAALGTVTTQLKEVIMSVVSPIVNKITSLYNEVVGKIRDQILNVVNKKLKPPLRKVKKKLAKIVSQAISPILEKLPMPARFIASKVVKKVLEKICDKIVGFIVKTVKEALKKVFDYGKDKIIEMLLNAFEPLKNSIMSSFAGRTAKQLVSKTQWLMGTDAGDVVKALPEMLIEQFKPMDTVYEEIEDRLSPTTAEMISVHTVLGEFLNSVYDGVLVGEKPEAGSELWDGIRGRRVCMYDMWSSPYKTQSISYHANKSSECSILYKSYTEWTQKKLIVLVSYADALENPTAKPSELMAAVLSKLPETMIVQSSNREELIHQIMLAIEQGMESSSQYARGIDDNIMDYICDLIGLKKDSIKYEYIDRYHQTLPRITVDNDIFPKWTTTTYSESVYTGSGKHKHKTTRTYYRYSSTLGAFDTKFQPYAGEVITFLRDHFCAYINEMLASLYVLKCGGIKYEQQMDGSYVPVPLTDMNGNQVYCYKHINSEYISVDQSTGILYHICPAFVLDLRDIQAAKKKKGVKTTQSAEFTREHLITAQRLASEEYLEKHPEMVGKLIPINSEQADLLNEWWILSFYPDEYPYKKPAGMPTNPSLLSIHIGDADKDPNGLRITFGTFEFTMNMRQYIKTDNPTFRQQNGFFSVNGIRYMYPCVNNSLDVPITLRETNPLVGKDKHGNTENFAYWQTLYKEVLDDDDNPVLDEHGNPMYEESEELQIVQSKEITLTCERILWYKDESSPGIDVSQFFFLSQPIKTKDEDHVGIGTFMDTGEDGITRRLRYYIKNDDSGSQYVGNFDWNIHKNACSEIAFISIDPNADKIQDRARLRDHDVPNTVIPQYACRDSLHVLYENERAANDESDTNPKDTWDKVMDTMQKAKKTVTETIPNAIDKAFDVVDFDALKNIEPFLSDAEQKVMNRLTAFMEDAGAEVADFASEFNDTVKNLMGGMGELVGKALDLTSLMDKVSSVLGATKGVSEVISSLNKLGDVATKINDTFESVSGSLDTSLVSELGAMVGPSMSLSNSIGEYDMSLTEKPKSLKPYCHDIDDNVLLKVGDLVLLMAVGNSTEHLYVLDLPYNNQIV
jgi:phage-related protein